MVNAQNFICSFSVFISIDFGTIRSGNVSCSPKSPNKYAYIKTPILASTVKVIKFGGNQKPAYDFILVINSNLSLILHRF